MDLKAGDIFYDKDKYKCHIVALLKNEKQPQIVYKYYGKHKQWWHYFVVSEYEFDLYIKHELWTVER